MRAGGYSRSDLPADAERRQAGHGAERQRFAAAPRSHRIGTCPWRPDHRADGALIGFDAVSAAAEGTISSVQMVTRKPPNGLAGAPYLVANDFARWTEFRAVRIQGLGPRCRAVAFPANVNVVAALSLARIGPDRTTIEIWADPAVTRNCHQITVESDSASFTDVDREYPLGEPEDRPHHRAFGDRRIAQARLVAAGRDVIVKGITICLSKPSPNPLARSLYGEYEVVVLGVALRG